MNNEYLQNLTEIESDFVREEKGEGSLSPYSVGDDQKVYVGYDVHPQDIEALYFEGLQLPRWESIKAENTAQQTEIYQASFQKVTSDYPLISRVSDTDVKVAFSLDEVLQLRKECERVLNNTDDAKAVRASQKFYIACNKAADQQLGLLLIPN